MEILLALPPHQVPFDVLRGYAAIVEPQHKAVEDEALGLLPTAYSFGWAISKRISATFSFEGLVS